MARAVLVTDMLQAVLLGRMHAAAEAGDDAKVLAYAREARATEVSRVRMLAVSGWLRKTPRPVPEARDAGGGGRAPGAKNPRGRRSFARHLARATGEEGTPHDGELDD